jgi:hypothetical protein
MPPRKKNGFIVTAPSEATKPLRIVQAVTEDRAQIVRSKDVSDVHRDTIARLMVKHSRRVSREQCLDAAKVAA